ncbi:MAG: alpha/beta hydrolase family protein, partial [Burkholderiales bacterium]
MKKPLIAIGLSTLLGCSAGGKASSGSTSNSDAPGSLESYAPATTYAVASLKDSLESKICPNMQPQDEACKNINEPHLKDDYGFTLAQLDKITNNVQSYTITYNTPGVHAENRSVSGGILIPHLTNKQEFKGIVLYFHPTEVSKYFVPSCFKDNPNPRSYCMGKSSYYGEELGAVLASQGYIVVMPDYIGQGLDNRVAHPYVLYPEVNALSGINMLTATKTLLTDKLGYTNIPNNLYIAGFSEGGAYALWTTKMLQTTSSDILVNNKLTLKRTAAMSGAYDLDKAQLPMELANTKTEDDNPFYISNDLNAATAKPILIAYLLSAYGFYDLDQNYTSLLRPEFFNCVTCLISGKSYTIADLFNDPNLSDLAIKTYLASAAALTGYWVNGD